MKRSIGTTFMLNFIIVFIVVTFAFLSATLSYMKAFKVNTRIANAIEKYEGYNSLAIEEIERKGVEAINSSKFNYCVYDYGIDKNNYRKYGIITYINLDLPIVGNIKIKVYSETEKMYNYG